MKTLQSDIYIPEATTILQKLLLKYDQQNRAAVSIILSQQVTVGCISLSVRVITQVSLPVSLLKNHEYTSEAVEKGMERNNIEET